MPESNNKAHLLRSSTTEESSMAASSSISTACNNFDEEDLNSLESGLAASSSTSAVINDSSEDTLRIYCCGTNYDSTNRGELISELYHYDTNNNLHPENIMILQGAGRAGHSDRARGLIDGFKDMNTNASSACSWVSERLNQKVITEGRRNITILVSGWSRGGVTAYIISNGLDDVIAKIRKECSNADELSISVKLFVVDPVAGPTNGKRRKLAQITKSEERKEVWEKMYRLGDCVSSAEVFYAESEKRSIMKPVFVEKTNNDTKLSQMTLDGKHSSLVEAHNDRFEDSINIVCKSAEYFYRANGISQDTCQVFEIGTQNSKREPAKRQTSSFTFWRACEIAHTPFEPECPERSKGIKKMKQDQPKQMIHNFKVANNNSDECNERLENRFKNP